MGDDPEQRPIHVEEALEMVRDGRPLDGVIIDDFAALLKALGSESPGRELRLIGCTIRGCDCRKLEVHNPLFLNQVSSTSQGTARNVFERGADFWEAKFLHRMHAEGAIFCDRAQFFQAEFKGSADFGKVFFRGECDFDLVHFKDWVSFESAKFSSGGSFVGANFGSDVLMAEACISRVLRLWNTDLEGTLTFERTRFRRRCCLDLRGTRLRPGAQILLDIEQLGRFQYAAGVGQYFRRRPVVRTCFLLWKLACASVGGQERRLRWTGYRFIVRQQRRVSSRFRGVNLICGERSQRREDLTVSASVYNMLRDNFRALPSADEQEDRCHYKYKDLTRRATKGHRLWRFWDWAIMKWCLGYGIYTKRILFSAVGVILAFAGFYACVAGPHTIKYLTDVADQSSANWVDSGFNPLYFSIITFTTIGYGDYAPLGWLRYVAGFEGVLGLTLMAVFTVSFARKLIR